MLGLAVLKEMLGDYESILKRLAGKKANSHPDRGGDPAEAARRLNGEQRR